MKDMKKLKDFIYGLNPWILCCIWSPLIVLQILLSFFLYNPASTLMEYIGWTVLWVSAFFGWVPIYIFKKKGGVPKGKSFVSTTKVVDSNIYAIVRHPQYLAGALLSFALILITQDIIITAIGIPTIVLIYLDIVKADQHEIEKFGEAYKRYMQKVPRANFVLGIMRLLRRKH